MLLVADTPRTDSSLQTMSPPDPSTLAIACHVRPSLVFEPIDAKIETLRRCEREGRIDALLLRTWPAEVALTDSAPHEEVRERVTEFEQWADRADVSVSPPFDRRETTSVASDQSVERLVTPTICLACYHDDQLVGVFPHTDGETTHTVSEAIAALRTGELPEPLRDAPALATPHSGDSTVTGTADSGPNRDAIAEFSSPSCSDCGTTLLNVQGILDCPGCAGYRDDAKTPLAQQR